MTIFAGKAVVVTGAGTGIGRVTARAFAARGASVPAVGRSATTLDETAADHPGIHPFTADVTEAERVVEAALPHLEAARGVVVNVSTATGQRGWPLPGGELYAALKSALEPDPELGRAVRAARRAGGGRRAGPDRHTHARAAGPRPRGSRGPARSAGRARAAAPGRAAARFYEEQGLVGSDRAPNGYRRYGPGAVARVHAIRYLLDHGLTLEDVAHFRHSTVTGRTPSPRRNWSPSPNAGSPCWTTGSGR